MMSVVVESKAATGLITDGSVIGLGGSVNAGAPMRLVMELIRSGVRDLTIVGGMTGTLAIDFLIAAGCVRTVICPYVGNPEVAPVGPAFRHAARAGIIDIADTEEGVHLVALRAAAAGLPHGIWRASVGTSISELNPGVELVTNDGSAYLRVQPLPIDVALCWAPQGTANGDVAWWRVSLGDIELAYAARHRIVQVDAVVDASELLHARNVSPALADAIVVAPEGPAPFAGPSNELDLELLGRYADQRSLAECRSFVESMSLESRWSS